MLFFKRILFLVLILGIPGFYAWKSMHPRSEENEPVGDDPVFHCSQHSDCRKITAGIACNPGCGYAGGEATAINKNYELEWQRTLTQLDAGASCAQPALPASTHWTCQENAQARCKAGSCVIRKMDEAATRD